MKNKLLSLLIFICCKTFAQYVTISDSNFVKFLQTKYPSAMKGKQMDTSNLGIININKLDVNNCNIIDLTGVQYFKSLDTLYCESNKLKTLPKLPLNLRFLSCSNGSWTNLLLSLPELPPNLTYLNCSGNKLTTLPNLPVNLEYLNCGLNQLKSLPSLPKNLIILDCSGNDSISTLPTLPNNLKILNCSINSIIELPSLPDSLRFLNCRENKLKNLPNLPTNLTLLDCGENQISLLPTLPSNLLYFYCDFNRITCFPIFPNSIRKEQQDGSKGFDISNNNIKCLPNYINGMDMQDLSYPLCSENDLDNNPFLCSNAEIGIIGSVSFDMNQNCKIDSNESNLSNIKVFLYDTLNKLISHTYTSKIGKYQFLVGKGKYKVQIDTANLPFTILCPKNSDTLIQLNNYLICVKNVNFYLTCKKKIDLGILSIVSHEKFFPGTNQTIFINAGDKSNWNGANCTSGISGQLQVSVSVPLKFI